MSYILVIETSTEVCSVALASNGVLVDMLESGEGQNHARLVSVYAEDLLARNRVKPSDLVAVAISRGPGSYTGLRIGVSTAKGFCYAAGIPLIAVGTLESMAVHVAANKTHFGIDESRETLYCPMIDARRMEVYSMLVDEHGNIIKPISAEVVDESFLSGELKEQQVVFLGNGSAKCHKVIVSPNAFFTDGVRASASHLCVLAWNAFQEKKFEDIAYFEPFYLKDFVATVSKKNVFG